MSKNILICPLDWGLGHATRCVPIIKALSGQGHRVIVAADNEPLAFLQKEFPDVDFIKLPGFRPTYSRGNSQILKMLSLFPGAMRDFRRDHQAVESIVRSHSIDAIISDNRFGCWSDVVHSVFITHQMHIQVPKHLRAAKPLINLFNNSFIRKYDELWVPDTDCKLSLSGKLSHPAKANIKTSYIGLLSRFSVEDQEDTEKDNKYLVILSGPEPQRSMLEELVLRQAAKIKDKVLILRAKPDTYDLPRNIPDNVTMFNHVDDELFVSLINSSENIICRGGYSSLMDLVRLDRGAYLVPTPGQTEQEYLCHHLARLGCFNWCKQSVFQLDKVSVPDVKMRDKFKDDEEAIYRFIENWIKII
ncbi:MAG: hypothetical protein MJZ85_08065 [Bacteroidales bacterium]|nr:hypothetical protein [Bacteroidales bacterium]